MPLHDHVISPVNSSGSRSLPVSDFILPSLLIAETSSSAWVLGEDSDFGNFGEVGLWIRVGWSGSLVETGKWVVLDGKGNLDSENSSTN
jgi:hypothetical protein